MKPANLFYTGVVVDDLITAQHLYTEMLGQQWNAITESRYAIETSTGASAVILRWSISAENLGHRIRLIQTIPGTVWVPGNCALHHHGYWSDDVDTDVRDLEAGGAVLEVRSRHPDRRTAWAYYRTPAGTRIELVDPSVKSTLLQSR